MRYLALFILFLFGHAVVAEVNIYSARKEALIKPILKQFTQQTGIEVNLITGEADALIKRLEVEGKNSPADILLTVDAARLHRAKVKGLLQPMQSEVLSGRVPDSYRDPENHWVALSLRSRVIVYAHDRIEATQLSTYEDLADEKWQGKLCVRSSSNVYNQSLVASMIAHHGLEDTEQWARGLTNNFARPPKGGDRDQVKAVAAGQCDLALVNTYYIAGMLNSNIKAEREAVSKVALFWPNQDDRGAHINISGVAITNSAKHVDDATRLIEYLTGPDAQQWYAQTNHEFPVLQGVEISNTLKAWGPYKADNLNLDLLGVHNADAVRVMDRAGWK